MLQPGALTLEPVGPRHVADVQHLAAHPDVARTTLLPEPYPSDGAATWIAYVEPRHAAGDEFAFAIRAHQGAVGAEDGPVVGVCGLIVDGAPAGEAELGYWIGRPYWNQGYATTACRALVDWAFQTQPLGAIFARPLARNAPSRRVLDKLGFALHGLRPNPYAKWDAADTVAYYAVTADAWAAMTAG
jgi:RimJ/RimL family protein N-acetyltransferase